MDAPAERDGGFDAVLLHQILNVVAEPAPILAEAARVLRVGGRVCIFDKFVADDAPMPPWREAIHRAVHVVFVTPRLRLGELLAESASPLVVRHSEQCAGAFRIVILEKV